MGEMIQIVPKIPNTDLVMPAGDGISARRRIEARGRAFLDAKIQKSREAARQQADNDRKVKEAEVKKHQDWMKSYVDASLIPQHGSERPIREIVKEMSRKYQVSVSEIYGIRKTRNIVSARNAVFYLSKVEAPHRSMVHIGKMVGGKDHTTVRHGIIKHCEKFDLDVPELKFRPSPSRFGPPPTPDDKRMAFIGGMRFTKNRLLIMNLFSDELYLPICEIRKILKYKSEESSRYFVGKMANGCLKMGVKIVKDRDGFSMCPESSKRWKDLTIG